MERRELIIDKFRSWTEKDLRLVIEPRGSTDPNDIDHKISLVNKSKPIFQYLGITPTKKKAAINLVITDRLSPVHWSGQDLQLAYTSDTRAGYLSEEQQTKRAGLLDRYREWNERSEKDIGEYLPELRRLIRKNRDLSRDYLSFVEELDRSYLPAFDYFSRFPLKTDHSSEAVLHKLEKGTILYHGSPNVITNFDRMAFFSLLPGPSKMILASGRVYSPKRRDGVFKKAYLYTLELKKDIYLFYNRNIPGDCKATGGKRRFECSPFSITEPIEKFCDMVGAHGFYQWRQLSPVLRLFNSPSKDFIKRERERIKGSFTYFFNNYVDYGHDYNFDREAYIPEIVLCDPNRILKVTHTQTMEGKDIIEGLRKHALDVMDNYLNDMYGDRLEAVYDLWINW